MGLAHRLVLDLADEVGDVAVVGVERASRDAGAVAHRGDRDLGEVTGLLDLGGEGVTQGGTGAHAPAVGALRGV